jgi:glycosyltransferase involved in cell wall biosynthesis
MPENHRSFVREVVSCIMPTRDRPVFVLQALRCFLRQTYRSAELVVVDDGDEPVASLCAGLPGVHYVRLGRRTPTGTKLNLGIERTRGTIIQKLDDDDYYHPRFLETALRRLPLIERDRSVVAWDCFVILRAGECRVRYSGHGWAAGGTLCFTRELWKRHPFRDVMRASDSAFLRDHQPRIVRVCAPERYMLVRHGANTWTRMRDGTPADDYLAALPVYPKPLAALLPLDDRRFYRTLASNRSRSTA